MPATVFARGVSKIVTIAAETTFGVQATGPGQQLRRIASDINVNVTPIQGQEILPSQQIRDARHGPTQVAGTISGQLSQVTYNAMLANLMRAPFAAGVSLGGGTMVTDSVGTVSGGTNLVIASASSNFVVAGFKMGDVVRVTGLVGGPAPLNAVNSRIVALAPNTMTLIPGVTPVAWATGQSIGIAVSGKKLIIPATGQVDGSFSIEHWFSDVGVSDLFTGVKVNQISLNVPASGFVSFQASLIGQQGVIGASQVYPTGTPPNSNPSLTAVGGKVTYKGQTVAIITGASMQIAAAAQADPTVGSNFVPAIFMGTLSVRGSLTALFPNQNDTFMIDFLNENEVDLSFLFTATPAAGSSFLSAYLPRVKLMAVTKSDSDRAIVRSFQFMALENAGQFAAADQTTLMIQDDLQP